jgi:phage virion morphogenesis protein
MQVRVDAQTGQVLVALDAFKGGLSDKRALLKTIGAGQLVSIRRTFADQGVPEHSWAPLAESTKKKKQYTAGHKLLIGTSRLLNSIKPAVEGDSVVIGTNVVYAAVHQFGSKDRGGAIGPQARIAGREANVKEHWRRVSLGNGKVTITNALGRQQTVTRKMVGPREAVTISAHTRFQNIPARPYLVFRPEDPARIEQECREFMALKARESGLDVK